MIEVATYRQPSSSSTNDKNQHPHLRSPVTAASAASSSSSSSSSSDVAPLHSRAATGSSPASASLLAASSHPDSAPPTSLSELSATPLQIRPLKAPPSPLFASHTPAFIDIAQAERGKSESSSAKKASLSPSSTSATMATAAKGDPSSAAAGGGSSSTQPGPSHVHRIRRGQKLEDLQTWNERPSLQQIDSPFQLQEYLALLVRQNPHDVETIVKLPQASVAPTETFSDSSAGAGKGKGKEADATANDVFMGGSSNGANEEEAHSVDTDVWVYEQLRRIVADFTTPWLTLLQRDCDQKQKPSTCQAMNADDWMYLCASHGEEKQCCAIDYIIHTLDGTTALLNSHRHFPSRTYIPTTSLRHFGSVSRRLSRIFVHAYEHHRDVFETCEAETSLYACFLTLVRAYDLIAIDSLPQLGTGKAINAASASVSDADKVKVEGRQEAETEEEEEFVPRGASTTTRTLFDAGSHDVAGAISSDERAEELDVEESAEDSLEGMKSSSLQRSDSNASRITAVHVGGSDASEESAASDEVSQK